MPTVKNFRFYWLIYIGVAFVVAVAVLQYRSTPVTKYDSNPVIDCMNNAMKATPEGVPPSTACPSF